MTRKATIYLDAKLYRAAKVKAGKTKQSLSLVMSDALRESLREDAIDLAAVRSRVKEPVRTSEAVLKDLQRVGLI